MRPLINIDIITFYNSGDDLLVLTADGMFDHVDASDVASSSYDDNRASAYDFVSLEDGTEVQILLARTSITGGDWFPDAVDDDGKLSRTVAAEMAQIINQDGILPSRALKAVSAGQAWGEAEQAARELAAKRAAAVAEVVDYCGGNQSAAGRILGLDQSTVNKLVKKARSAAA